MKCRRILPALLATAAPAATSGAQGSDSCSGAQSIAGSGTFAFALNSATTGTEGQSEPECVVFGTTTIHRDVWFAWTAPSSGRWLVQSCGLSGANTKIAVYAGAGCPSAQALACNDDFCGLQSAVVFDATAGSVYALQVGLSNGVAIGGSGSVAISVAPPVVPCSPSSGPDLVVGDLWNVANFTASGGFDVVSVGTNGCNVGSALANWIADVPEHPLVRQNVYRHKFVDGAGRFEQVGMSWLKHTYGAAQESTLCTCNPGGNFTHLGVGCSDPYDAGTNAAQPILGPNWEVNPHTGVYPYPFTSPPFAGVTARRCRIALTDLEPSSAAARYLAEAHYVARDDAAAGNQDNNASWRALDVTGGPSDFAFDLSGPTHVEEPAILAWDDFEPGVLTSEVQVPGDGRLVVASHATLLSSGLWRYEYAVYNMNVDRAVGSFSVPLPDGVSATSVGFHDVDYHDGDGPGSIDYDGADWVDISFENSLTWLCEMQIVNVRANALRWGTLYNFRFDADSPPVAGTVYLELWKSGGPAAVTTTAKVPEGPMTGFCAGDGSVIPCPCANDGLAGHGCANSLFFDGAGLRGFGTPHVSFDTASLDALGMSGTSCVFFQGDAQMAPIAIDDGLGCVTGAVVRLGTKPVVSFSSSYPQAGDPSISVRGALPPAGGTRYYQCFYRNAAAAFCPPATSNRTNGVEVVWAP